MGHPFKEEIIAIQRLAEKQDHVGDSLGYRFHNESEESFYRNALNNLIKAHKTDRDYRAGATATTRFVSMFIPFELDEGREFGIKLDVQFTNDSIGGFITIEVANMSRSVTRH